MLLLRINNLAGLTGGRIGRGSAVMGGRCLLMSLLCLVVLVCFFLVLGSLFWILALISLAECLKPLLIMVNSVRRMRIGYCKVRICVGVTLSCLSLGFGCCIMVVAWISRLLFVSFTLCSMN